MQLNIFSTFALLLATGASTQVISDCYIVKLSQVARSSYETQITQIEDIIGSNNRNARSAGGNTNEIRHKYQKAHYGFSAQLDAASLELVRNLPNVEDVDLKTFGAAKKVNLVAVKIYDTDFDPDKDMLDEELYFHIIGADYPEAETSSYIDEAVSRAVDDGIVVFAATGNETKDACLGSPARAPKVITVGATTVDDELAYYSNFGKFVDILAPGSKILSTWIGSTNATNTISGTSIATAHVAGLSAVLLSQGVTPWSVANKLKQLSIKNTIAKVPAETAHFLAHYPGN